MLCKTYSIPIDSMNFVQDNIFPCLIPNRIGIESADNNAFDGGYKKSLFEFNHCNSNSIEIYLIGHWFLTIYYNLALKMISLSDLIRIYVLMPMTSACNF